MIVKRVVWKDSFARDKKPVRYRKHTISGYGDGWITNIPNDDNVYCTHYDALNAIDKHLGGTGQMGGAKRAKYGINIVGKKTSH